MVAAQCRTATALTFCCSGGGPWQPWSSGLAPVPGFSNSSPSLIGLLASVGVKQQSLPHRPHLLKREERRSGIKQKSFWRSKNKSGVTSARKTSPLLTFSQNGPQSKDCLFVFCLFFRGRTSGGVYVPCISTRMPGELL